MRLKLPLGELCNGYFEETYFTFCYSAIRDKTNAPGGVLVTCVETTPHVIGERRLHVLRELAGRANDAESAQEAAATAARALATSPADVPFALVYLFDRSARLARLLGASALELGATAAPLTVDLDGKRTVLRARAWEGHRARVGIRAGQAAWWQRQGRK